MLQSINEILIQLKMDEFKAILTFITTLLAPFVYKMIRNKEFRVFMIQGLKNLVDHFSGKGLNAHYLFTTGKLYRVIANSSHFPDACTKKNELFKILLTTKVDCVLTTTKEWIKKNNKKLRKFNVVELQIEFYELINAIVSSYEKEIPLAYFRHLKNDVEATEKFNIIYYGEGKDDLGFKTYHEKNVEHIINYVDSLPTYVGMTNEWLVNSFMNELDTALRTSVRDIKTIFENKNGRLCK